MLDIAVINDALAKLEDVQPMARELENMNATHAARAAELAKAKAELAAARAETNSLAAERDRVRADLASSRAELLTVHAGLAAGYKELERLERQQKGKV
jgi:hypothetical protein